MTSASIQKEVKIQEINNSIAYLKKLILGLEQVRDEKRSQKEVCGELGISQSTYGRWMREAFLPLLRSKEILSEEMIEQLLWRTEDPTHRLLRAVFGVESVLVEFPYYEEEDVQYVLDTLTEQEQLFLRYKFGFEDESGRRHSTEEIAVHFGVAKERVQMIVKKGLRKLRGGNAVRIIFPELIPLEHSAYYNVQVVSSIRKRQLDATKEYAYLMSKLEKELDQLGDKEQVLFALQQCMVLVQELSITEGATEQRIEDVPMSNRTYHCLSRAGLTTLEKISGQTRADLLAIRNMGVRSVNEIEQILEDNGMKLRGSERFKRADNWKAGI